MALVIGAVEVNLHIHDLFVQLVNFVSIDINGFMNFVDVGINFLRLINLIGNVILFPVFF